MRPTCKCSPDVKGVKDPPDLFRKTLDADRNGDGGRWFGRFRTFKLGRGCDWENSWCMLLYRSANLGSHYVWKLLQHESPLLTFGEWKRTGTWDSWTKFWWHKPNYVPRTSRKGRDWSALVSIMNWIQEAMELRGSWKATTFSVGKAVQVSSMHLCFPTTELIIQSLSVKELHVKS